MVYDVKKREMSIFEIITLAFMTFRENFRGYIDIVLLLGLPLSILFTLISNMGMGADGMFTILLSAISGEGEITEQLFNSAMIFYFVYMLVQTVCLPLITMAGARFTQSRVDNEPFTAKEAVLASISKGHILIFSAIIKEGITYALSMSLFILTASFSPSLVMIGVLVYFAIWVTLTVYFYFYAYAIILDNKGIISSLMYSVEITKGTFAKTFLAVMCIYFMDYSLSTIVQYIFTSVTFNPAIEVITRLAVTVCEMIFITAATLLYINKKCSKNGFCDYKEFFGNKE